MLFPSIARISKAPPSIRYQEKQCCRRCAKKTNKAPVVKHNHSQNHCRPPCQNVLHSMHEWTGICPMLTASAISHLNNECRYSCNCKRSGEKQSGYKAAKYSTINKKQSRAECWAATAWTARLRPLTLEWSLLPLQDHHQQSQLVFWFSWYLFSYLRLICASCSQGTIIWCLSWHDNSLNQW